MVLRVQSAYQIDEPGEYYIDRENGYYIFIHRQHSAGIFLCNNTKNIIDMKSVSNVTIQGMTIEGCRNCYSDARL